MEVFKLEDEEVEFPLCEEDDYPSLCVEDYIDQLNNDNVKDEFTSAFSNDPQMTFDHLSEDEIFENLTLPTLLLTTIEIFKVIKMVVLVMLSLNTF